MTDLERLKRHVTGQGYGVAEGEGATAEISDLYALCTSIAADSGCQRDTDPQRIAAGYTTDRWDVLSRIGGEPALFSLEQRWREILEAVFERGLMCLEAMIHRFPAQESCGIAWHRERDVAVSPEKLVAAVVLYPQSVRTQVAGPLEVRRRDSAASGRRAVRRIMPGAGTAVVLEPDVQHRVPTTRSARDRFSIVLRYYVAPAVQLR